MVPLEAFAAVSVTEPQKEPEEGFTTTAFGNGFTVTAKFADTTPLPHALVPRTVTLPDVAEAL
jgi:hypothetical protein